MKTRILLAGFSLSLTLAAQAAPIRLPATPALTPDGKTLVFEWNEDLWTVPSTGGMATALTRHPATERYASVSPDGQRVAFMSGRDDTFQVWTIALTGGAPQQVTFHSDGATPQDWFPDGKRMLIRGARESGKFLPHRFIAVEATQRAAEEALFDDYGDWGRVSPDGSTLLFMRDGEDLYRRGYHGSKAATIWTYDFAKKTFACVAKMSDGSEARWPMWKPDGKGFYLIREGREGTFNLFERDLKGGGEKQLTFFKEFPVVLPTISRDGSAIVFRNGFDFYLFKPGEKAEPLKIQLEAPADESRLATRRESYTRASNEDEDGSVDFSADTKQIVFAAGGDLWVMDTVIREPVAVTTGTEGMDNFAEFSADEKAVYFLRDTGDAANIWKAERADPKLPWWRNRFFELTRITSDQHARTAMSLDPTGERLAWMERPGDLWVARRDGSEARKLISSPAEVGYDWSPDGKWICASVQDSDDNRDVWILSVDGSVPDYNLSRHPNWDGAATWSPDGRVIAYIGRTYDNDVDIYYAWLREKDHGRLERETERIKAGDGPAEEKKSDSTNKTSVSVQIDFDGLADRVQRVKVNGTSLANLFWSWDGKALAFQGTVDGKSGTWKLFFPHPGKAEFMTANRGSWAVWSDKAVCWSVDGVPATLDTKYPFTVRVERDLTAWRRLGFLKMWRIMRDQFYDPRLNNCDWGAIRTRYEPLIPDIDDSGFNRIVSMMLGELNASHLDFTPPRKKTSFAGEWTYQTGSLGVTFDPAFAGPGLRVVSVLEGAPASREFTKLQMGDVVLAVNDVAVGPRFDLTFLLNGVLPRDANLVVERGTNRFSLRLPLTATEDIRKLAREAGLDAARKRVATWSKGRAGYIDIAHMQTEDLRQFEKEVYAQGFGRDGLVIDVRNNTGGFTADQILSILCHPAHAVTIPRGGVLSYQGSYLGRPFWMKPIVVLCNAYTVSNGEIFSHAIKNTGRGKLVGQITQGGVISTGERQILNLGTFRVPHRAWFPAKTGLDMEHHGAVPDVMVDDPPAARAIGEDPQLKTAVETLLKDLDAHGKAQPKVRFASEEKRK